jgi:hypothetical protein
LDVNASPAIATVVTATDGASSSYTMVRNRKTWNGSAWQPKSASATSYSLSSSGTWDDGTVSPIITANADGSITSNGENQVWMAVDLSGVKIKTGTTYNLVDPAITGGSAVINVGTMPIASTTATYPAGSRTWIGIKLTYVWDRYEVYYLMLPMMTRAGNLTSLNFADVSSYTLSNPLCLGGFNLVYSSTPTANTATFNVYQGGCAVIAGGTAIYGTVDLTYKTVRTQAVAEFSNYVGGPQATFIQTTGSIQMPSFLALINGTVWRGVKTPAGTNEDVLMANGFMTQAGLFNKTAMDEVMAQAGKPSF